MVGNWSSPPSSTALRDVQGCEQAVGTEEGGAHMRRLVPPVLILLIAFVEPALAKDIAIVVCNGANSGLSGLAQIEASPSLPQFCFGGSSDGAPCIPGSPCAPPGSCKFISSFLSCPSAVR